MRKSSSRMTRNIRRSIVNRVLTRQWSRIGESEQETRQAIGRPVQAELGKLR